MPDLPHGQVILSPGGGLIIVEARPPYAGADGGEGRAFSSAGAEADAPLVGGAPPCNLRLERSMVIAELLVSVGH
jgi:hypothetical protein